ncbi:hypothetical protein [Erythrobacter aureus]|uniref:DUF5983 domain-containing protein n=1 Tax=Erythrobacter aureus TaxID=2182384 RepID=A0A345YJ50_9SPHN|nr:hypothetical protein [Erythrobacter aureus]AXK43952.1 hypothetical protein DVR09_15980 [Erythrobacter aureus]
MYAIVSHFPSDDINCPGIEMGPAASTKDAAIEGWKEARLTAYEESGAKDPEWAEDQPDSTEGLIMDLASGLRAKVQSGASLPIYEFGDGEQAYLVEIPALPDHIAPGSEATAPTEMPGNVGRFITLTVDRLHLSTQAVLGEKDDSGWANGLMIRSDDYCYSIYVPDEGYFADYSRADYETIPEDLRRCFDLARENGATWIAFTQAGIDQEADGERAVYPPNHIFRYADLSTGHLDFPTADALNNPSETDQWVERLVYMSRDNGWFVHIPSDYVNDEDYAEIPKCLRDCFDFARKDGATWILFDSDGCMTVTLPTFEW